MEMNYHHFRHVFLLLISFLSKIYIFFKKLFNFLPPSFQHYLILLYSLKVVKEKHVNHAMQQLHSLNGVTPYDLKFGKILLQKILVYFVDVKVDLFKQIFNFY